MEIILNEKKVVSAKINNHIIITDQPLDNGGEDSAPSPFDLYLASIGTCAGIYVKSFCDKRNIPTDNIRIFQKTSYSDETGLPTDVTIDIKLPPEFPENYIDPVRQAAGLCKVKKSIADPPIFQIFTSTIKDSVPDL